VLVADDESLNRSIASGFLSSAGHEVVCVDNGAAAVEAAAARDFDVILMDVRMPGMDGLEATRRIRALPTQRGRVPVVAVTAQVFAEQVALCRQAGMDGHVAKPFKQAVLLAAVESVAASAVGAPGSAAAGSEAAGSEAVRSESAGSDLPPTVAFVTADAALPVLDHSAFEDIADSLLREELESHLRTLITRSEALAHRLLVPWRPEVADELAEAAHMLAGSAGIFGFLRVADAARRFERAAGTAEAVSLAARLAVAAETASAIMRQELADVTAVTT
jgi:CheY-like chemotaxis protein/HPt (histidine-containing phosphotransfer) domain-containing protein